MAKARKFKKFTEESKVKEEEGSDLLTEVDEEEIKNFKETLPKPEPKIKGKKLVGHHPATKEPVYR